MFYNPTTETRLVGHGDDFTFLGYAEDLVWIEKVMKEWYTFKTRGTLGPDKDDLKEISIL